MPPHRPHLPPPPQPTKIFFGPFNSPSTGHQRAESRLAGSTSWRDLRFNKLSHQFKDDSGCGGDQHVSDLAFASSKDFGEDARKENGNWESGASGLREKGWQDIRGMMAGTRKRSRAGLGDDDVAAERKRLKGISADEQQGSADDDRTAGRDLLSHPDSRSEESCTDAEPASDPPAQPPQIFRGLTIYLNGSTAPLMSDHKLKQVFTQRGGNASIALGRRTVTHVIIGETCGGGLASGKINKEITTVGGKGIKFVTAQWIIDSVEKGKRQPEGKYQPANLSKRIGGKGQRSVRSMFTKA